MAEKEKEEKKVTLSFEEAAEKVAALLEAEKEPVKAELIEAVRTAGATLTEIGSKEGDVSEFMADRLVISAADDKALEAKLKTVADAVKKAAANKDFGDNLALAVGRTVMANVSDAPEFYKRTAWHYSKQEFLKTVDEKKTADANTAFDEGVKGTKQVTRMSELGDKIREVIELHNTQEKDKAKQIAAKDIDTAVLVALGVLSPVEDRINKLEKAPMRGIGEAMGKAMLGTVQDGKFDQGKLFAAVSGGFVGAVEKLSSIAQNKISEADAKKLTDEFTDEKVKEGFGDRAETFKKTRDAVANSHESTNGFVRATVAVGAGLILWNRIRAMFGYKEVEDPEKPGEMIKKRPSVFSQILSGVLVLGAGFLATRVAVQGRSFGDVGNELQGYWTSMFSKDKPAPLTIPGMSR